MKKVVHKLVCDVCNKEFEVDEHITELLYKLSYKIDNGLEYNMNLTGEHNIKDIHMDICSNNCLFNYATSANDDYNKRISKVKTGVDAWNFDVGVDCDISQFEEIGETPLKELNELVDLVLPPVNTKVEDVINEQVDENQKLIDDDNIKKDVSPTDDVLNLSIPFYMIVKLYNNQIFVGGSDEPIRLNECIIFSKEMIVFSTMDSAKKYKSENMKEIPNMTIVKILADPQEYHSNNGRIKYCIFPA